MDDIKKQKQSRRSGSDRVALPVKTRKRIGLEPSPAPTRDGVRHNRSTGGRAVRPPWSIRSVEAARDIEMIFREFDGKDNVAYQKLRHDTIAAMAILHLRYKYPLQQVKACRDEFSKGLDVMLTLPEKVRLDLIRRHCRLLDNVDSYLEWSWIRRTCWRCWKRSVRRGQMVIKQVRLGVKWFQGSGGRDRLKVVGVFATAIATLLVWWLSSR